MSTARAYDLRPEHRPIHVHADPNGIAYDHHDESLYVADARSGAILCVAGEVQRRVTTIDSGGVIASSRIGGLAVTPYGTLYVTRLGYGRAGGVFRVEPDGTTEALAGLPVEPWRVGLTYDAQTHALYVTQFRKSVTGPFDGTIVKVDLASGEATTVASGLTKPVGVARLGGALVVTDARARAVYRVALDGDRETTLLASGIDRPDSCVVAGHDSVLVTTYDEAVRIGAVRQIWLDGRMRTLAHGSWEPRGITTDYERIYVSARRAERVLVFPLS